MQFCDHCALPVSRWAHSAESEEGDHAFCCYGCFVGWQSTKGGGDDSVAVGFLIRLGVGAFLSMNIMLISLLLYSGALDEIDANFKTYAHGLLWVLATPALLVLGAPFFKESIQGIRQGHVVPAMLISLGSISAYSYSAFATVLDLDRVYFDTTAMVLVLFTLGRYLEANGRARAARSLRPMMEAEKQRVTRLIDAEPIDMALSDVLPGMLIQVEAGERIPIDGLVMEGVSQAQETTLTGEPYPVEKMPGSTVLAGSLNGDQMLLIDAQCAGLHSQWITICRDVRAALSEPSPLQQVAEKVAVVFVPLVLFVAAVAVWLNWESGDSGSAMLAGLAVLVVACPCALGLAAPLATSLALTRLVGEGIVLRNAAALETLASLRTMALDKTGTLTTGRIVCSSSVVIDPADQHADVLRRAASIALGSMHPLSLSILDAAEESALDFEKAHDVKVVPGMGVCGTINGVTHYLGNERWLREENIVIVHSIVDAAEEAAKQGLMVSYLAWGDVCRCVLLFTVATHPDSPQIISALHNKHIDTIVLTGDGELQTSQFCKSIGVPEWSAQLTPNDKKELLNKLVRTRGCVAMVGDGVNDALALTAADVGIAVGNATQLTQETADVVLHSNDISQLLPLLSIAAITKQTIVSNLFWAFGYNVVAIALAASGLLQPILAALLMAGSSLIVIANTMYRLNPNSLGRERHVNSKEGASASA